MNNNSFVSRLEDKDVHNILDLCGLRVSETLPEPISVGENEDGTYTMLVKAFPKSSKEDNTPHISAYPLGHGQYLFLNNGTPSYIDDAMLINIDDFTMYEIAAMQDNDYWLKSSLFMTNIYQSYMTKKFGKEYDDAYKKFSIAISKEQEEKEESFLSQQ